ncbi:MAG: zinc ABC transporter substrate-binding protein [Chloroflexi bacterium]|nr:zinc ABC transporter substrate-binding protein [Chloroflexota bacterium]
MIQSITRWLATIGKGRRPLGIGLALALLALAAPACGRDKTSAQQGAGPVSVVTTLYALEYFAGRIGGDAVAVANLVPAGVEAHDYEPDPAAIRKLKEAEVVAYAGGGFDPWVERALKPDSPSQVVVQAAPQDLLRLPDGTLDPHLWLDPVDAQTMARLVQEALAKARPGQAEAFTANAQALLADLSALHQRYQAGLRTCAGRVVVTSHAAFGHLAARYGLEQVPIAGLSPEAEPAPGDLAALSDRLKALGARYIMVEPILSQEMARGMAREIGAQVLPLHPLESLTPEESQRGETYFSVMEANLESLRVALECTG